MRREGQQTQHVRMRGERHKLLIVKREGRRHFVMQDGTRYKRTELQCVKMDFTILEHGLLALLTKTEMNLYDPLTVPPFPNTLNAILSTLKSPHRSTALKWIPQS